MDKGSTFVNFYIIKLTYNETAEKYEITGLKNVDVNCEFSECDYYILIYRDLAVKTYFEIGKLLYEAGSVYGENIIGKYSKKLIHKSLK